MGVCRHTAAGGDMSMKENDKTSICDSRSFRQGEGSSLFEHKVFDNFPNDNEDGAMDEGKSGSLPQLEVGNAADKLMLSKTRESRNSGSVHITISDIFDMDAGLSADKNVLACESPNSRLFTKEANCHNEEMPLKVENKEVSNYELLAQFRQRVSEEHTFEDSTTQDRDPEDSMQIGASTCGSTGKIAADSSQEESFVDRLLPVQEFGTRSFLRSFLNSFDNNGSISSKPLDHSQGSQDEQNEDDQPSNIVHNSKVEIRSMVEQASETRNVNSLSCENDDELGVEPRVMSHRRKISGELSAVGLLQRDKGDSSFSAAAAGIVSVSGKIGYSGSLSLQSDGSATSSRSFAFPLLQSEWNASPARMVNVDGSGFRKQQGWRSGLLCCRF